MQLQRRLVQRLSPTVPNSLTVPPQQNRVQPRTKIEGESGIPSSAGPEHVHLDLAGAVPPVVENDVAGLYEAMEAKLRRRSVSLYRRFRFLLLSPRDLMAPASFTSSPHRAKSPSVRCEQAISGTKHSVEMRVSRCWS